MPVRYTSTASGGGGSPVANPLDAFSIGLNALDTNSVPTDGTTFVLNLLQAEVNSAPVEAARLAFTLTDSSSAPTDGKSSVANNWHASQTNTGTSGITNPGNLIGSNDGVFAVLKTVSLGTANISITAASGVDFQTGQTFANATYRGFYKFVAGTTSTFTVTANWTGGGTTTIETGTGSADHSSTPKTVDLFALGLNTVAKAQTLTVVYQVVDTVAGLGGTLSIDAGAVDVSNVV